MSEQKEVTTNNKKSNKILTWAITVIGLIAAILGSIGVLKDDQANNTLVDLGTSMAVTNMLVEYPEAKPYMLRVTTAIDNAIAARNGDTENLINNLQIELKKVIDDNSASSVALVVTNIINMVNDAHAKSQNEEMCIKKLSVINEALKTALAN